MQHKNKIVLSQCSADARVYLPLPFECGLVSYGSNIVVQVSPRVKDIAEWYIEKYAIEHCFATPNILVLNEKLMQHGYKVCFMAEYFLPDVNKLREHSCCYETKVLIPSQFTQYYTKKWSNALCEKRKHLDMLAVGAFDGEKLIGLAGASADCKTMYQIGADVLPEYREKGIAASITSKLAIELLKLGIVPFYGAAWSNIKSVRNALKIGFKPAWVELFARKAEFVDEMNK